MLDGGAPTRGCCSTSWRPIAAARRRRRAWLAARCRVAATAARPRAAGGGHSGLPGGARAGAAQLLVQAAGGQPRSIPDPHGQTIELAHGGHTLPTARAGVGDWSYRIALDSASAWCASRAEAHACQLVMATGATDFTARAPMPPCASRSTAARTSSAGQRRPGGASAPAVVIAIDVAAATRSTRPVASAARDHEGRGSAS